MKRVKFSALCIGVLLTLCSAGCVCTPNSRGFNCSGGGYYGGANNGCGIADCGTGCDTGCDANASCSPCDTVRESAVYPYSPCLPKCGGCLKNVAVGTCLVGRGVLDIAAAPFLCVGNLLSHDYGCLDRMGPGYDEYPCADPCTSVSGSSCNPCSRTVEDGTIINDEPVDAPKLDNKHTSVMPKPTNKVVQASYLQPKTKFGTPRAY
jgi:hypothetical protein